MKSQRQGLTAWIPGLVKGARARADACPSQCRLGFAAALCTAGAYNDRLDALTTRRVQHKVGAMALQLRQAPRQSRCAQVIVLSPEQ